MDLCCSIYWFCVGCVGNPMDVIFNQIFCLFSTFTHLPLSLPCFPNPAKVSGGPYQAGRHVLRVVGSV
jgi:hypothetical protein